MEKDPNTADFDTSITCGYEAAEMLFQAVGFDRAKAIIEAAETENDNPQLKDFYGATADAMSAIAYRENIPVKLTTPCDLIAAIEAK